MEAKLYNLRNGYGFTHTLYDYLVFNRIKAILGGRVRIMFTGSAPMNPDVQDYLKIAFGCELNEGFGMSEGGAINRYVGDPVPGHVGGPGKNCKLRLRDLPEMNYLHTNDPPTGEIMVWGTSTVTKGYFRDPVKTAEAISADGWLATGDVGMLLPHGGVKIIDRAKNIFKLS